MSENSKTPRCLASVAITRELNVHPTFPILSFWSVSLLMGSYSYFLKPVPLPLLPYKLLHRSSQSLPPSPSEAFKGQEQHVRHN